MTSRSFLESKLLAFLALLGMLAVVAGCGGGGQGAGAAHSDDQTPVTLGVFVNKIVVTDEDFQLLFQTPVENKYPYIHLQKIEQGPLENLVSSGQIPDIVLQYQGTIPQSRQLGLVEDITPLLKKSNIDIGRFDPTVLAAMKVMSDRGELYGLPYGVNFNALYYNKDLFDRFGVPYPKDGMTWEDAMELAGKLSRTEGGIKYRGLEPEGVGRLSIPLSLNMSDPKTNRSLLNTDPWKKVFEQAKSIYTVPGNEPAKSTGGSRNEFVKNKTLAMLASVNIFNTLGPATDNGLNWDVAQYPSYKELPNTYGSVDAHWLVPVKTSKHQDAVMKVLEVVTSDETQTISARQTGRLTPLKNEQIRNAFAAELPFAQGKQIKSIFKSKPAAYPEPPMYGGNGGKIRNDAFDNYFTGKQDLNTALREAEEKHNQAIEAEMK